MSKVVIVNYTHSDAFKIPKGLDLEDKEQVEDWSVKYNTLYIYKTDGSKLEIQAEGWIHHFDYKYPQDETIENRDDHGIDYSDDEEEEEDEEQYGTCIKCGIEGKFIGKQDDEWTCIQCLN